MIEEADALISELITTKKAELKSEKDDILYNATALAALETIGYLFQTILDLFEHYQDLRK